MSLLEPSQINSFRADGAICLRGLFTEWVEQLREGVETNRQHPGPYFAENVTANEQGSFWDDYCNWQRIAAFRHFIEDSPAAEIAADIMQSSRAQFFHDHVLVKEAFTSKPTPWHQDAPYYFVSGEQTVSFWLPLDTVNEHESLRFIAGSHLWQKPLLPVKWKDDSEFYLGKRDDYIQLPDPDAEDNQLRTLQWTMQPGDAVLFDFRTVHGARANLTANRRRAFSMRWVGDDACYVERPGRTSPPFPGHNMRNGERLREDWFPVIFDRSASA